MGMDTHNDPRIQEHARGEHADFVDMDCPTCCAEWEELTRPTPRQSWWQRAQAGQLVRKDMTGAVLA